MILYVRLCVCAWVCFSVAQYSTMGLSIWADVVRIDISMALHLLSALLTNSFGITVPQDLSQLLDGIIADFLHTQHYTLKKTTAYKVPTAPNKHTVHTKQEYTNDPTNQYSPHSFDLLLCLLALPRCVGKFGFDTENHK